LYTDTDSLIYEVQCNDLYRDIIEADIHTFDTTDLTSNNEWKIPLVHKKIGIDER
jgi:hypothetical protein